MQVRVLLDTGPTEAELGRIRGLFAELDLDAVADGHSYGGPPPTSAFLIVLNSPLVPFLDHVARYAPHGLTRLIRRLQAMRADESCWGRAHGVQLEDSHGGHLVAMPPALPAVAYRALPDVDLSSFDRGTQPVRLQWHPQLHRWQVRLATAPRPLARRAPSRWHGTDGTTVRQVTEAEISRLWALAGDCAPSAVNWQRASVVLGSILGWNIASIARHTVMNADRVRAVIHNFNEHGFDSLELTYRAGEGAKPTPEEERDAVAIAGRPPSAWGVDTQRWDAALLGEFLVTEGIAEDVDPAWLESLLRLQPGAGDR